MRRRNQYLQIKWLCGIVLISLGIGMLLAVFLPYCIPLLAILFIGAGIWLIFNFWHC
ncbi:hypothetical protein [Anaerotignum sp.]|uniref:hypothetical protein n=1 Tax=Anaerotignum sp. TaxID=2039241 RepID=UPI002714ED61|nr:hypothetical protein [Anaerotignum sp.]